MQAKSHRGGANQPSMYLQPQNKKMKETSQDLNQFIKTLEKYGKNLEILNPNSPNMLKGQLINQINMNSDPNTPNQETMGINK